MISIEFSPAFKFNSYANAPVGYTFTGTESISSLQVKQVLPTMNCREVDTEVSAERGFVNFMNGLSENWANIFPLNERK